VGGRPCDEEKKYSRAECCNTNSDEMKKTLSKYQRDDKVAGNSIPTLRQLKVTMDVIHGFTVYFLCYIYWILSTSRED